MTPGSTVSHPFVVRDTAARAVAPDALPTADLTRVGTVTTVPVTITAGANVGEYEAGFTIPATWLPGESVGLTIRAVLDGSALVAAVTVGVLEADLSVVLKYHDNTTRFFGADGTTEVPQAQAYFMTVYDDDGTTVLKRIEFQNAAGAPTILPAATRYVRTP